MKDSIRSEEIVKGKESKEGGGSKARVRGLSAIFHTPKRPVIFQVTIKLKFLTLSSLSLFFSLSYGLFGTSFRKTTSRISRFSLPHSYLFLNFSTFFLATTRPFPFAYFLAFSPSHLRPKKRIPTSVTIPSYYPSLLCILP